MATPDRRPLLLPALTAAPGLSLAAAGLFHPHGLSYETSDWWFGLHVPGLLFFPLVVVGFFVLVQGRQDPLAWAIRISAYVYATFYTALDVISGIAAGWVTNRLGPGVDRPEEVTLLFRIGTPIGEIGSGALLVCCALLTIDLIRRHGKIGAVGLVLVCGAYLVHVDHIFAPTGVIGMAQLGLGTGVLVWLTRRTGATPVPAARS